MNATSFDVARETIAGLMDNYSFGKVLSVKVPDPNSDYYHGYVKTDKGTAWFQQSRRGRRALEFGPLELAVQEVRPRKGDFLVGKLDGDDRRTKFVGWYSGAGPLKHFYDVCVNGTRKCEVQLMESMCVPGGDDRVWALCRLLMFGNIGVFARENPNMNLNMDVVAFVHKASTTLRDASIWDAFVQMVPTATVPRPPTPPPEPQFVQRLRNSTTTPQHAWGAVPIPPPDVAPMSPPYNPMSPPSSPPYNPMSPPSSPPYNPISPPSSPHRTVPAQMDIETLSSLISQYCPPPVLAYDPCKPAYDSMS